MSAKTMLEMASTAAVGASALLVAALGALGFSTWRRQAKSEAAQKLIGLAKKARTEIQATRTMVTYPGEALERERGADESEDARVVRDERYARMKRLERPYRTIAQLYERGWEAGALLGIQIPPYLDPIAEQLDGVRMAIDALFVTDTAGRPVERRREESDDARMKVYGAGAKNDTVAVALDEAVRGLQRKLKRYI